MNIGQKIRNIRIKKKITQTQIAQKLKVTKGYISRLENNFIKPSLEKLLQLLQFLHTNPSDFFIDFDFQQQEKFFLQKNFTEVDKKDHYLIKSVFPLYQQKPKTFLIEIKALQQITFQLHQKNENRLGFVFEGEITILNNQETKILVKGDCFYFSPSIKNFFFNHSDNLTKILLILI